MSAPVLKSRILAFFHPIFFATAPILLIAAANIEQIELEVVWLPLALSIALMFLLTGIWWVIHADFEKTALLTSFSLFLFFFHGHMINVLCELKFPLKSRYLFAVWALLLILASEFLRRRKCSLPRVTQSVTTISFILFLMSLGQLFLGCQKRDLSSCGEEFSVIKTLLSGKPSALGQTEALPDIYYIILDGYAREDILRKTYGFDNSGFIRYLQDKGFVVASESHSNYAESFLSLASSLNMRYVNQDIEGIGKESLERGAVYRVLQNHDIGRYLQFKGYHYVHFNTNWAGTEKSDIADCSYPFAMREFHAVLLKTTMLDPLVYRLPVLSGAKLHLYHFQKLKEISRLDKPTFTFAHICCPHHPYYFDRFGTVLDGRQGDPWKNREGYLGQLIFVNDKMREVIDAILENSSGRPIIVIQADHGTRSLFDESKSADEQLGLIRERMPILNAYYVPEQFRRKLYPTITPVNTFRLLLQTVFNENVTLLPDRIWFSWYDQPYDFVDVTGQLVH